MNKSIPKHNPQKALPVIAIGASAGGLEACSALLQFMPRTMPAAFILIQHLDPTHQSMMVDLLEGRTGLKVVQATDGLVLSPGVLHVIPPGVFLTVAERVVHLDKPMGGQPVRLPFDVLLQSLARDGSKTSACIVLSGTGNDGSLGIVDFHAAGGLVIAQEPTEAEYSGMPDNAIATGLVSQTLRTSEMVAMLEMFLGAGPIDLVPAVTAFQQIAQEDDVCREEQGKAAFDSLLSYLGQFSTQDLPSYKRGTLERRIERRMARAGLGPAEMARYLCILQADAVERTQLLSDLLIHVSSFFRDTAVFDHLTSQAIPDLLTTLPQNQPLRVWVAGCSTGEEAYSIAIACFEAMQSTGIDVRLKIFASDTDPNAIAVARTGFYSKDIESCVSPERLSHFFVAEKGGWRVTSILRDQIVFTVADLLSDPPFSKIDILSCRNVLIYLEAEAKKLVMERCCFALRRDGLLLLGTAEMPSSCERCFTIANKDAHLWRRSEKSHLVDRRFENGVPDNLSMSAGQAPRRRNLLADLCCHTVVENYAPAAVLLTTQLDSLYMSGPTERYLRITQGHAGTSILSMLPKRLHTKFRAAAASCGPHNPRVTVLGCRVGRPSDFDIALHSVAIGTEQMLLACFLDSQHRSQTVETAASIKEHDDDSTDLTAALEAAHNDLSDALLDLEQEVAAHSADLAESLSIKEEFQSTNEELLASKEELQSLNEELKALNSQLQETLERYRTSANDLQNVLYSSNVATLFLDLDLNIRFYTPAVRAIFHVIPTDVGRPLADLAALSRDDELAADARAVLDTAVSVEKQTAGIDNQWYSRRIQPYRAEGGRLEGIVITYFDITERIRSLETMRSEKARAEKAARVKARFLASASHDLRQPLQSMALLYKLLENNKIPSESGRLVALFHQTLNAMTAMLNSMLDISRIESGMVLPDIRSVKIGASLQRLTDELSPQFSNKNLSLRMVPCSAVVLTDPQLLDRILRNLLSNALKYTSHGGALLGCRHKGEFLNVLVCDTGIGISESEINAIFEPYHQVNESPTLSGQGLGLGLSIVQQLAHLLRHEISVSSTLGKGSCFTISLPIVENSSRTQLTSPRPTTTTKGQGQTGTILVVVDEESLRTVLTEVLFDSGHNVIAKANVQDALAWAGGEVDRPDLLLMDFDQQGGTSGIKLARDLQLTLGGNVPTIILMGDISRNSSKYTAGDTFHQVMKPVTPEDLLANISDLMLTTGTAEMMIPNRNAETQLTLHVVDDDLILRDTMSRLFEANGWTVFTYASAEEFLAKPIRDHNACLLIDNLLPGMDGVALITRLRERKSLLPAIVLTAHGDAAIAVAALKAGASDLIEKPASAAEVLTSVRQAVNQSKSAGGHTESQKNAEMIFSGLTPRQCEVMLRVMDGQPNKIIAADLGISQRTVENHRAAVMRKTGAKSLPALVRLALAANIQAG